MEIMIKVLQKEVELINALNENEIKFKMISAGEIFPEEEMDETPMFLIKDLRLCVDINYLIESDENEVIDELRFHELEDVISFLKNY